MTTFTTEQKKETLAQQAAALSAVIAEKNLKQETIFFRAVKNKEGQTVQFVDQFGEAQDKRPQFEVALPYVSGDTILNHLADDTLDEAKKERLLKYLSDLHNGAVYTEAQKQINDAIKGNPTAQLTQSVISLPELDLWALAYKEPTDRKVFSDELIASAIADFVAVGIAEFKRPNGEPVPAENINATAKVIFTDKFKGVNTDKAALKLFQSRLAIWFDKTSQKDNFMALASNLQEKIDLYLNKDTVSKIGSFE